MAVKVHTKIVVVVLVLGVIAIILYKSLVPKLQDSHQRGTSDSKQIKQKILIGVDNWIGYFPLCSPELRKRMRYSGYLLQCVNDDANYDDRYKKMAKNKLQFAVGTIDSYLLNAKKYDYPATIISVLDESRGGDALVAWQDQIKNLDQLKKLKSIKLAFTPNSPSEHLIKSLTSHFDIALLRNRQGSWRVETGGSSDALKALKKKKVNAAVLWEPDVTRALQINGVVKLIGTEDTNRLIVDILLVNRKYSSENPEVVRLLLKNYFQTLKHYNQNKSQLIADAASKTKLSRKNVETLLKGVRWVGLLENVSDWYGVSEDSSRNKEWLIDTIHSTARIQIESKDFTQSPVPQNDPYRLTNRTFIQTVYKNLYASQFGKVGANVKAARVSLRKPFGKINTQSWNALRVIGTLKIRPIVFQSGTAELTQEGKSQVDKAVEHLRHYPNFRVMVKGHTATGGDESANRELSKARASSVVKYMIERHQVNINRLKAIGLGSSQPLEQLPSESFRAYQYRLPRVELFLVAEDI